MTEERFRRRVLEAVREAGVDADRVVRDQHFLVSERAARRLVEAGALAGQRVLELGAGPGVRTEMFAETCASLVAVEIDRRFERHLEVAARQAGNVEVRWEDLRDVSFDGIDMVVGARRSGLWRLSC
jgi:16S rRNA A1518/A1519 N6-dimethyltransferase RsmA/KsgA/DIM1 with predicted DNA glycosylase/AP lyase activity